MATDNVKTLKKVVANYKKRQEEDDNIIYDPAAQSEGYKKRIEGSGLDVEKETDKRNFIEKAFNLPEDQNPIFDIFEIINRPQQAIFGAIEANQKGEDVLEGAKAGITGEKRTPFKNILNNAGITQETEGRFGADDVFGFMGDVFLDPADLALFPVAASAKAAKVARMGSQASKVSDAVKAADAAATGLKGAEKVRKSVTQLTLQGIGTGIKKTISLTDTGLENVFHWMDNDIAGVTKQLGVKAPQRSALKSYRNLKEMLVGTFDYTKQIGEGLFRKATNITHSGHIANAKLKNLQQNVYLPDINKQVDAIAKKYNYTKDEVEELSQAIFEIGADAFDETGKLTLKGQNRVMTMRKVIESDSLLVATGVNERTMKHISKFLDTYFPDIKNSYITNGKGFGSWFVKTEGDDILADTYRIVSPEVHTALKKRIDDLHQGNKKPRIKHFKRTLTKKQKLEKQDIVDEISELKSAKAKGAKKVIRRNSPKAPEFQQQYVELDNIQHEIAELTRRGRPRAEYAGLTTLQKKQRVEKLLKKANKHKKNIKNMLENDGVDVENTIKHLEGVLRENFSKTRELSDGELLSILTDRRRSARYGHLLSNEMVTKLEEFAKIEELPHLLNTVGEYMTKSADVLQEVMGSSFKLTDGYLAHTMSDDWAKLNIDNFEKAVDESWATTKMLKGNTKAFQSRKYAVSKLEANATAKNYLKYLDDTIAGGLPDSIKTKINDGTLPELFARDLESSLVDFATKSVKATEDARMLEMVLSSDVFDFSEVVDDIDLKPSTLTDTLKGTKKTPARRLVMPLKEGGVPPRGYAKVSTESLQKKLEQMHSYTGNKELYDKAISQLSMMKGKQLLIDYNVNVLIARISEPKEVNELLKGIDQLNAIFKKNKLLSPGFQLRNIVGNISNMWLSGMSIPDIYRGIRESNRIITKGENLFKEVATNKKSLDMLNPKELEIYTEYTDFIKNGFSDLGNALHDIPEELWNVNAQKTHWKAYLKKKAKDPNYKPSAKELASFPHEKYNKLVAWNMEKNQAQDALFRMTAWRYAKGNPEFLQKMGHDSAESYVRKTLFDFQDLSVNERETMRRLIPFYTFTKKNLGFQLQNLMKNGNRYHRLTKSFNSMWGMLDLEDNELDKFKVENFWIPIPFKDKDGKYKAIKSSLPLGDLGEFLDRPLQRILSATAPIARAPFEMALNKQVFSEMPIQEFKGQRGFYIPELGKKAEYGLSQVGLDVPAAAAFDVGRTAVQAVKGEIKNPLEAAGSAFGRTVMSTGDPAKTAQRNAYDELDDLQNLMRYYKQEGIDILKLAEIENQDKFGTTKNIIQRLREINNR